MGQRVLVHAQPIVDDLNPILTNGVSDEYLRSVARINQSLQRARVFGVLQ